MEQAREFNYHLLKVALQDFHKNLSELNPEQWRQVNAKAVQSFRIESQVLRTGQAAQVVIGEQQLNQAVAELAQRYEHHSDFIADLRANHLDEATLRSALWRELVFDAVLQRISADICISQEEVIAYYQAHPGKFMRPEKRLARHILITINPEYLENTAENARQRLEKINSELQGQGELFAHFAQRYSECPSAMQGGQLGEVSTGTLYHALEIALFSLPENAISAIVESPLGLHLLWCEKIIPAYCVPFEQAAPQINAFLTEQQRRIRQKNWLAGLIKEA